MTRAVSGVGARLGRAFLLQGAFIGIAAIVSVFLANVMLEGVLIRQALRDEASFYWSHRGADPAHPLPATLNLTGYIGDAPREIATLAPGFHDDPVRQHTGGMIVGQLPTLQLNSVIAAVENLDVLDLWQSYGR